MATASDLNLWTISQIENEDSVTLTSLIKLLRALDGLNVLDHFQINEVISPLAYAKLKKEQRRRASGNKNKTTNKEDVLTPKT